MASVSPKNVLFKLIKSEFGKPPILFSLML